MAGAIGVRLSRASAAPAGILACATPERWLQAACEQWHELLIDHAYCEKKAASSAVALIFAYPECEQQSLSLARLAREELRHFEQVTRLMRQLAVPFRRLKPGRYAGRLRAALRTHEPARRVDLMLAGALIEARSCERFAADASAADQDGSGRTRLAVLAALEAELISGEDDELRFHSGPPRASVSSS